MDKHIIENMNIGDIYIDAKECEYYFDNKAHTVYDVTTYRCVEKKILGLFKKKSISINHIPFYFLSLELVNRLYKYLDKCVYTTELEYSGPGYYAKRCGIAQGTLDTEFEDKDYYYMVDEFIYEKAFKDSSNRTLYDKCNKDDFYLTENNVWGGKVVQYGKGNCYWPSKDLVEDFECMFKKDSSVRETNVHHIFKAEKENE